MKRGARVVLLAGGSLLVTLGFFALAVAGWGGDWGSFLANPVRPVAFVAALPLSVIARVVIGGLSDRSPLSSGLREDRANRWIFLPGVVVVFLTVWVPPFTDRRDLLTIDGDTVRWIGLVLAFLGGLVRLWTVL